jgi:hypothetical protein
MKLASIGNPEKYRGVRNAAAVLFSGLGSWRQEKKGKTYPELR